MSAKKRRPGAVTPERQTNKGPVTPPNSCPHVDCSTVSADVQGRVSRFLRHGAENAITTFELVQLVGCDTVRQLQDLIREERNGGCLILSTSGGRGGYYLPSTDPKRAREEISRFVATLLSRASNTFKTAQRALDKLSVTEGQLVFDDAGTIRDAFPQPWRGYEADKGQFEDKGLSPGEYTKRIRKAADERGL